MRMTGVIVGTIFTCDWEMQRILKTIVSVAWMYEKLSTESSHICPIGCTVDVFLQFYGEDIKPVMMSPSGHTQINHDLSMSIVVSCACVY